MHHYRIKPEELAERLAGAPLDGDVEVMTDPETGDLLLRSREPLAGLRKTKAQAFDDAHRRLGQRTPPEVLAADLQAAGAWRVEPGSPRKAEFARIAGAGRPPALRIELGPGRGDTTHVGRPLQPHGAKLLRLSLRTYLPDGETLAVGAAFTTDSERPWLALPAHDIPAGQWHELTLDLTPLDAKKLPRADRLVLVLVTDADTGAVLLDRLSLEK